MAKKKSKVLLIGWDAADWKVINPLIDSGKMPALERLINNGVMGDIQTLEPVLSPMLWSSIGTGKLAEKHGVLGFTEPDTLTGAIKPISVTSRKVKAIWNILTQNGYKTNLVGWWPSHPAEPINGVCVSNFYQPAKKEFSKKWEMAKGTVHPESMSKKLAELRVHPQELTEAHILPFVPNAAKIDQENDKRYVGLTKTLAETATIHACSTYLLDNTEWDFMGIYFDGIDHFCHGFMKFHPPKLASVSQEDFEMYKDVINSSYIFHDMMLDTVLSSIDEDTTVILISDHGFHSDHLRPEALPKEPAAPAYEHRKYGIFCAMGPGIKKDEIVYGTTLLDITPTILNICDLPVGQDMDGKVLSQIFETPKKIETIPSWEDVEGFSGMHPDDLQEDPIEAQAALEQLIELGYIEKPDENSELAQKHCVRELKYNLARQHIFTKKFKDAVLILEELVVDDPNETRFLLRIAQCYQELREYEKAHEFIKRTKEATVSNHKKKRLEIIENDKKEKEKELKEKKEGKSKAKTVEKKSKDDVLTLEQKLTNHDKKKPKKLPSLDLLEASILIDQNKPQEALDILNNLAVLTNLIPKKSVYIGRCYQLLKKWPEAEKMYRSVLSFDRDDIGANHGLALSLLRQKKYNDSIEASLNTIALSYNFAVAHYHLGEALSQIGDFENALNAFNVCLKLDPNIGKARIQIINILEKHPELAKSHTLIQERKGFEVDSKALIAEQIELMKENTVGEIVVVSGLPRSGTSMMMQMLVTGGMEAFTDNKRIPDISNPKGYYEHEEIKKLNKSVKILNEVGDKVVKIISHLLINLPSKYKYKVVFMTRDLDEVLTSQHKMLVENKAIQPKTVLANMKNSFTKNLDRVKRWAAKNHNVDILYVSYPSVLSNPKEEIQTIVDFLGKPLDKNEMATVVDKSLYRNKVTEKAD